MFLEHEHPKEEAWWAVIHYSQRIHVSVTHLFAKKILNVSVTLWHSWQVNTAYFHPKESILSTETKLRFLDGWKYAKCPLMNVTLFLLWYWLPVISSPITDITFFICTIYSNTEIISNMKEWLNWTVFLLK